MNLKDKNVVVTGANHGIGQALVEEALRRGAKRVYAGTRQPLAHPDGRVTPLILDVTNAAQIKAAVESVESLDILVNNAGLALYDDLSDRAALERHLAVNLFGTYDVTQAFLPLLARSRGAIVNSAGAIAHWRGANSEMNYCRQNHTLILTLGGGSDYTATRISGSATYQGRDRPGCVTFVPAGTEKLARYRNADLSFIVLQFAPEFTRSRDPGLEVPNLRPFTI
jgi:NAD(P)-dependent dehydrogenase (short-subunit alcohol dehydrogenase family)